MKIPLFKSFFFFFTLSLSLFLTAYNQNSPIKTAIRVAEKVMEGSSFSYYPYRQNHSGLIQTIDFRERSEGHNNVFYAFSYLNVEEPGDVLMGISSGCPVKVWVNNKLVYAGPGTGNPEYREIAYGIYSFDDSFSFSLTEKENEFLIKAVNTKDPKINLGAINKDGTGNTGVSFELAELSDEESDATWITTGPFQASQGVDPFDQSFPPESGYKHFYNINEEFYSWQLPVKHILLDMAIPETAAFRSHPYTEWHYSNGATMWSIIRLSEATGEKRFKEFPKKFCEVTLADYPLFKYQYYGLNEYHGHNHRIWRMHMLDDASAPALPFVQLYAEGELAEARFLIERAAKYASEDQFRLDDQTLCRPEPVRWSVWGDDLFMYVPFILKYAKITGRRDLEQDAIHQAKMFYKYLYDKEKGLYYHGWFSDTDSHSVANWSRANGWITWAMSELLVDFPGDKKQYRELKKMHREHLDGLLEYQDESGLWHQVLDHPESFLETSGTAMFTIALARGVNDGWLGEKYRKAALKAWKGIESKIQPDGTVEGICQGTGIGETMEFYMDRETPLHDPRGVGAVITAGIEVEKILKKQE